MTVFTKRMAYAAFAMAMAALITMSPMQQTKAADHSEAKIADANRGGDIADVFLFLDPNDPTKLVVAATLVGFIVPSENVNQGGFDERVRFRFEFQESGTARVDRVMDITFSERTSTTTPQMATIKLPGGQTFSAPTTVPSLAATAPAYTVTTDPATGVAFFAGLVDDPFIFDIVGFNRFVASVLSGTPDPTQLSRGRDSFSGYNDQAIAVSIPLSLLNFSADSIGVDFLTQVQTKLNFKDGDQVGKGNKFFNIDRMGNPAVNTVLVPFARKDEYNQSSTADDAAGKFLTDLATALGRFGTDQAHTQILAGVAIARGDALHLNRTVPNTGTGGGNNAGGGFPNGRRLGDDVIDTILFLVSNEALTAGDHVNANDKAFTNTFPFFATPHQPLATGAQDTTQN